MDIYYSQLSCLEASPAEAVDKLIAGGAENVELMLDGRGWWDFHNRIEELAEQLSAKKVTYAVHVPVWDANLTCENVQISEGVLQSYKQSILLAAALKADHVVVHPGFCQVEFFDKDAARARAAQHVNTLLEFAKPYGVRILVENVGSNQTSLYTMEQYIEYCTSLPEGAAALIDIGHAHINGWDFERLFRGLGSKLHALHIHDNSGTCDSHSPVGDGTVDWKHLALILREMDIHPTFILEYSSDHPISTLAEGKRQLKSIFC